jgi:hypothetical protein
VDPVPDPLLLRKSGSAGNRNRTPGSVARNLLPLAVCFIYIYDMDALLHASISSGDWGSLNMLHSLLHRGHILSNIVKGKHSVSRFSL